MGNTFLKQDRAMLWVQRDGPGTPWVPLGLGTTSATGRSRPGKSVTAVYSVNRFGQPVVLFTTTDPPGGLPGMTIGHYDEGDVSFLEKRQQEGCPIYVQIRYTKCGSLDNPKLWDAIDHNGLGIVGDITPPDGPVTPYAGAALEVTGNVQFQYGFRIVKNKLSGLTSGEAENLLDLTVVSENICNDCGNGYPGSDKIIFISAAAGTGVAPNILVSSDGGGSFSVMTNQPFAADENAGFVEYDWVDTDTLRVVVGCSTTDAAALAKIAYVDVVLGAYTAGTWTNVVSTASDGAIGEVVTAMKWLFNDRLYIATDGGYIYVVSDQAESWADDAVANPAVTINGFAKSPDGSVVWAFGATNTIMREVNQNGVFVLRTGPSGGGAFTALAVANEGTIYAGNGTAIYKSINEAGNAGGWSLLKDFGASHVVKHIECVGGEQARGGDSQLLRVAVDDTTPGAGSVFESVDGGATWTEIAALANAGYNAAAGSNTDNNRLVVVGDASGGAGIIHLLNPA